MKAIYIIFLILVSCTMLKPKDKTVHKHELMIWNLERTYKKTHTNSDIFLIYKTCFKSNDRKYDFWESLRVKFKEKFDQDLIGLSDAESKSSSHGNVVCLKIKGNPVTEKKMKSDFKGDLELFDPNHPILN